MPLTTTQIVEAVQKAGLTDFTARKLERWANLGVIPHPHRKGKGRGRGWEFLWPDQALVCALLIADAFTWQHGRRFEDAVLWAWLRGAPIPLPVVRRYLVRAYRRLRSWLKRRLKEQRRERGDEPLELVDRLAQAFAYRHEGLRTVGVPTKVRLAAMQEVIPQLVGQRWSDTPADAAVNFRRAWDAIFEPLGIPWATDVDEVGRQQAFFEYQHLTRIAQTVADHELLAAGDAFARGFYRTAVAVERMASGQRLSAAEYAEAELSRRIYSILFKLDPAWAVALMLYEVLKHKDGETGQRIGGGRSP